jgi:hypothetical protein
MPKEHVMGARWHKFTRGALDSDGGEEYGMTGPEMYIHWGNVNDGNVQICLTPYPETPWEELKMRDGFPVVSPAPGAELYSGVLSRKDINHLIKVLRRARDSAYGHDE